MRTINCKNCAQPFTPTHSRNVYCKSECKPDDHPKIQGNCIVCGQAVARSTGGGARKHGMTCSNACRSIMRNGDRCEIPDDHWARIFGTTCEWKAPRQYPPRFTTGQCRDCAGWFTAETNGSPIDYCSDRCAKRVGRRRRRAREHNAAGDFRYSELMRVYLRQGQVCAYCELPIIGLPDPEHVLPLSRGGRNDITNLVAACRACNADKNDLTLTEWAEDRARRGLPVVRTVLPRETFGHLVHSKPTGPAWRDRPNSSEALELAA